MGEYDSWIRINKEDNRKGIRECICNDCAFID
jgi:hypothetical protein